MKNLKYFIALILIVFLNILQCTKCYNILFLGYDPLGSRSHKVFYLGISEALLRQGHHITLISSYYSSKRHKNLKEIILDSNYTSDALLSTVFLKGEADNVMPKIFFNSPRLCVDTLGRGEMQALKNQTFDLIMISMFFNYCYLYYVDYFKVPFIYVSPAGLVSPFSDLMGNIDFPSIVPNKLLDATFPATFVQRAQSTILNSFFASVFPLYLMPKMFEICKRRRICPLEMPSFVEINNNASLAIVNSVRALESPPRPTMPNIIYAGGIHIKAAKNLSKELELWIEGSGKYGFIFFSLGSAFEPSIMPERYRRILLKVFGSLKQRVLWKWDDLYMPDLPQNVKLQKWLPQQDVLGHPKLRLFITHGGLLSTQESTFNSVPIIGMPIFADQFSNINEAEKEGWGKVMHWSDLKEQPFRNLIINTIHNKSIRDISRYRSKLMRDKPLSSDHEIAFWIEYVIRHNGAAHIMSPFKGMSWYEIYNLDVWSLIFIAIICTTFLCWWLVVFTLRLCIGLAKSQDNKYKWD